MAIEASAQELTGDKVVLVRFYAPGIVADKRNSYAFATVAVITGVNAFICGLLDCDITIAHIRVLAKVLKPFGVQSLSWIHKGRPSAYRIK